MTNSGITRSKSVNLSSVLSRTQGVLRRHVWLWPLMAAIILAFVGVWVRNRMEGAMKAQLAGTLKTILTANAEALRAWQETVKSQAEVAAEDNYLAKLVTSLEQRSVKQGVSPAVLLSAQELIAIRTHLQPTLDRYHFNGFVVLNTNAVVLASARDQLVGLNSMPGHMEDFRATLAGSATVTRPFPSVAMLTNRQGQLSSGVPTMFATAPIRSADGRVIAVLGLRMEPREDFTRILATARMGNSGETFAFDRKGLLLSDSRFDEQLKHLSLIPDSPEAQSILTLELRDPLVDLSGGKMSPKRRAELPLTHAVAKRSRVAME